MSADVGVVIARDLVNEVRTQFRAGVAQKGSDALAILKARVAARHGDASDATPEVVDRQLGYDLGVMRWQRIDAAGSAEAAARAIRERRPSPSAGPA